MAKNVSLTKELEIYLEPNRSPCVVCGGSSFESFASQDFLEALRCNSCDMVSVNPHLSEEGLDFFYSSYYAINRNNDELREKRKKAYQLDYEFLTNFASGGKVLDVGCSDGSFLSYFDNTSWEKYGIDLQPDALRLAASAGVNVRRGKVWETDFEERFDLITMRGVLEHFRDPNLVLRRIADIIRPGGKLFISATPMGDSFAFWLLRERWKLFTPYEHIHFFGLNNLNMFLGGYGFSHMAHTFQYAETEYSQIPDDYKVMANVARDGVLSSGTSGAEIVEASFPGSMITGCWVFDPDE